jgi:hypothetical protein
MLDPRTEAGRQLVKEAGWGLIAKLGAKALPFLLKHAPKLLKHIPGVGKMLAGHAANPTLWKTLGHGALRGAKWGAGIGGGMGALGGAVGAAPGESKLWGAIRGGAGGALKGGLTGGAIGGAGSALRYGVAPKMYQGAQFMRAGPGGEMTAAKGMSLSPEQARLAALSGGRVSAGGYGGGLDYVLKPKGIGRAISWLPGAATMGLYQMGGGGGAQPQQGAPGAAAAGAVHPAYAAYMQRFGQPGMPKGAKRLGELVKQAKAERVRALVVVLEKTAKLPQFNPVPLSAHTAIADYIKNKKYKVEPNDATSDEQARLNSLVAGMSKSRARVVGAHRRARNTPQSMLKHHFQAAGLWG